MKRICLVILYTILAVALGITVEYFQESDGGAGLVCQEYVECPPLQQANVTWNVVPSIRVNLTNRCLEDFCKDYSEFQLAVAEMGNRFLEERNYNVSRQINPEDVLVRSVDRCSINATACVKIEFGLPVNMSSEEEEPQLSVSNLQAMWDMFASEPKDDDQHYENFTCTLPPPWPKNETYDVRLGTNTSLEVYCENHSDFRFEVAAMVVMWLSDGTANFSTNHNISKDNIVVTNITQCTDEVRVPCVRFTFGVILTDSDRLNSSVLQEMWRTLALVHFSNAILEPAEVLWQWHIALIIMVAVLICFSIILCLLRKLAFGMKGLKNEKKRKKSQDSRMTIVGREEDSRAGGGVENIDPHSFQTLPSFFESEYPYYEPSLTGANLRSSVLEEPIDVNRESMFVLAERNPSDPVPNRPHSFV